MKTSASLLTALLATLILAMPGVALDYDALGFSPPEASSLSASSLSFPDANASQSLSVSVADDLVYKYGFYAVNGSWERFSLSGEQEYDSWIPDSANASLDFNTVMLGLQAEESSVNYVVTYSCSYDSNQGAWDCHDNKWQLQQFNASLSGGCVSHDTLRCLGGDVYWYNSCRYPEEKKETCAVNETCLDGACVPDVAPTGNVIRVQDPGVGNDIAPHLDEARQQASDGDTIQLPAGSFRFNGTVTFYTYSQGDLHIKGAGSGPSGTKIYRDYDTSDYMLFFSGGGDQHIEISDIWFEGPRLRQEVGDGGSTFPRLRAIDFKRTNFYVHDCRFENFTGYIVRTNQPNPYDCVVSNNVFANNAALVDDSYYGGTKWNGGSCISVTGEGSEWPDVTPGTEGFVFVEDNYFSEQASPVTGGEGGRYVFRRNYVERNTYHGVLNMHPGIPYWHNPDYEYSTRFIEVYGNTFVAVPDGDPMEESYDQGIVGSYGGEGVIWNNTIDGYEVGLTLKISPSWWDEDRCAGDPDCPSDWEPPGYPIPYQHGWESGSQYGWNHTGTDPTAEGAGDFFIWDNTFRNIEGMPVVWAKTNDQTKVEDFIQEGRDYHLSPREYTPHPYPHPYRE